MELPATILCAEDEIETLSLRKQLLDSVRAVKETGHEFLAKPPTIPREVGVLLFLQPTPVAGDAG